MIAYLFIIASLFASAPAGETQLFHENKTTFTAATAEGTDYAIIRCYITRKTNRTHSHFEIDLGSDENHPLKKRLIPADDDLLIGITEDNKQITLTSEVDALKFMSDDGWSLVNVSQLTILDKDNMQYLFSRAKK